MTEENQSVASTARRIALRAFGIRIRSARRNVGYTQETVAETLRVSTQTIRNWEAGRTEPTEAKKQALEEAYGLPRESLMELNELPADDASLMLLYEPSSVSPSRLLDARLEAGLTQVETAQRTGINRNTIGRYENGRMMPSRYTLGILASTYGKEVNWFLDPTTERPQQPRYDPLPKARNEEGRLTREKLLAEAKMALADAAPDLSVQSLREVIGFIGYIRQRGR